MTTPKTMEELAGLSDEEIMAMEAPPQGGVNLNGDTGTGVVDDPNAAGTDTSVSLDQGTANADAGVEIVAGGDDVVDDNGQPAGGGEDGADPAAGDGTGTPAAGDPAAAVGEAGKPEAGQPTKPGEQADVGEAPAAEQAPDYKAVYDLIMKPFKANGREISVRSPEELIRLAQMGANYTVKLQELQPQRRIITMLGNHGLLDESRLSYLIDLDKKNPQAIAKLLKDSGINPMDLQSETADYQPVSFAASDAEMAFTNALEAVKAEPEGEALIQDIISWDEGSKKALGQDPSILGVLAEHKTNGLYDTIAPEAHRQRTINPQYASLPFLVVYREVGMKMQAEGKLASTQDKPAQQPAPAAPAATQTPIATRVATPAPAAGADKVRAAAPARSAPKPVLTEKNFLNMSDEEFAKETAGRL